MSQMNRSQIYLASLRVVLLSFCSFILIWDEAKVNKTKNFQDIKRRPQYLSVAYMQTLVQEYLASQAVNSLSFWERKESMPTYILYSYWIWQY